MIMENNISTSASVNKKRNVLITGAGGFIGSFIVERALEEEFNTWAGIRKTTSREFLTD